MGDLFNPENVGLTTALVLVLAVYALQRVGERLGEDFYDVFKGLLRRLLGRKPHQPEPAGAEPAALAPTPSAPAVPPPLPAREPPAPLADGERPLIATPAGAYFRPTFLAEGELARLYRAELRRTGSDTLEPVVLKIARDADANTALRNEVTCLKSELLPEAAQYAKHLPLVIDQFRSAEGNMGVALEALDGLTLEQLRTRFPAGVDPRHVLWIFRRCLSALGYVHSRGVLHGNLTPAHILVRPQDHNIWLLDWTCSVIRPAETGQGFLARTPFYCAPEAHEGQRPIPASDLYSLGKCMVYAFGGDPATDELPAGVPEPLVRFTRFFLKESPIQRPQDAWEMYIALERIRDDLYGPHRFVEFVVPD